MQVLSVIKEHLPVFVVIVPLVFGFILPPMAKRKRLVEGMVLASGIILLGLALYLAKILLVNGEGDLVYHMGGWKPPWGIEVKADSLASLFLLVIAGVGLPVSLYSVNNLAVEVGDRQRRARFFTLLLLSTGALAGMAITNDLFNVFVLVEVTTLSCCGLVSARNHPKAAKSAFRYLVLASIGSAFLLFGIGLTYILTGNLNMTSIASEMANVWAQSPRVVWLTFSLMLVGLGVKSALFPLHVWLPDAHTDAPAPASAILSGLAIKGYIICLVKILFNIFGQSLLKEFGLPEIIVFTGLVTLVAGSIMAINQKALKRRLAYSTVAQVGYIFIGVGLMNEKGLAGGLFYIAAHAVSKSLLFLAAGTLINTSGKTGIKDMAGIGRKMPLTAAAFTVGSLSLIGLPLFSCFVGKWNLLLGSHEAGSYLAAGSILLGSVLAAVYLFPVIRSIFFDDPQDLGEVKDPAWPQALALIILSLLVLALGSYPGPVLELARRAAGDLLALGRLG